MNRLLAAALLLLCISTAAAKQGNDIKCSKRTPVLQSVVPEVLLTEDDEIEDVNSEAHNLDECVDACCSDANCYSAFFLEGNCFTLACKTREECMVQESSRFPDSYLAFVTKSDSLPYKDYNDDSECDPKAPPSLSCPSLEECQAVFTTSLTFSCQCLSGYVRDEASQHCVPIVGSPSATPRLPDGGAPTTSSTTPSPTTSSTTPSPTTVTPAARRALSTTVTTTTVVPQQQPKAELELPSDSSSSKDKRPVLLAAVEQPTTTVAPTSKSSAPESPTASTLATVRPLEVVVTGWEEALQLPASDEKKLHASVARGPGAPSGGHHYRYSWLLLSNPVPGVSVSGGETATLKLSKLKAGLYRFRVTVQGQNPPSFGETTVNMTVLPPPRVNVPPVAVISPASQEVTLPAKETLLDGSESTDDDRIVSYSWDEVKGPLRDKAVTGNEVTLKMTDLVPGDYIIKLTVTDSDGVQNSTFANVTVHPEVDYPPVANAGTDAIVKLPHNQLILYGNGSTDDKDIVSYEWTQRTDGVADMSGTKSQFLHLSQLEVGTYSFELKVTDTAGQTSFSTVTVIVKEENVQPPEADAGSDKEISWPADHTSLEGSTKNLDNAQRAGASYRWVKVSGPEGEVLETPEQAVTQVSKLVVGVYVFSLTVTNVHGLKGSDTVTVTVKEDKNEKPVARAGGDKTVQLPALLVELDGSGSTDDLGIKSYQWTRDPNNPASAIAVDDSEHKAVLKLVNLVPGNYRYKLTVTDIRGLTNYQWVSLTVKPNTHQDDLVELNIQADIMLFTTRDKDILKRKLAIMLEMEDEDVVFEKIEESLGTGVLVEFYVVSKADKRGVLQGTSVVEKLRAKLQNDEKFLKYVVVSIDTLICQNDCSGHGHCDKVTKQCVCEKFWLENPFKKLFGEHRSNCEWSILYVILAAMALCLVLVGIVWLTVCLVQRRKSKIRKKRRYAILDSFDEEESMEMLEKPNNKHRKMNGNNNSSIMISDSGSSSEEDTIYETKLLKAGKSTGNSSSNGKSKSSNGLVTKIVNTRNKPALLPQSQSTQVM